MLAGLSQVWCFVRVLPSHTSAVLRTVRCARDTLEQQGWFWQQVQAVFFFGFELLA